MSQPVPYTDVALIAVVRRLRAFPNEVVETHEFVQDEMIVGVDFDPFGVAMCWHKIGSDHQIVGIFRWKRDSDDRMGVVMREAFEKARWHEANILDARSELPWLVGRLRNALKYAARLFRRVGCAVSLTGVSRRGIAAIGLVDASPFFLVWTLYVVADVLVDDGHGGTSLARVRNRWLHEEVPQANRHVELALEEIQEILRQRVDDLLRPQPIMRSRGWRLRRYQPSNAVLKDRNGS